MITSGQQLFINNAVPTLRRDPRIAGVALGGSYIRRETMDEFSGLDFVVAIHDEQWDSVFADRVAIAEKLGTLLASFPGTHINSPNRLICLYDEAPGHVDLSFVKVSRVGERFDDPVIMYQEGSLMSDEFSKHPLQIVRPDLQWFEDRFWIWVHFTAGRIGRAELFDAIESLSFLRVNVLAPLISMKNGFPPRGVRHLERDCPEEAAMLVKTLADYDRDSCLRALKATADMYIWLRGVNKSGLFLRDKAETRALKYMNSIAQLISDSQ